MNKIFNWTIGSMFRTIGRFIGLLLISCLFGFIIVKSGIKITDIFGVDYIKASTVTNWSSIESRIWYDQQGTNTAGSWSSGSTHTFSPSYPVTSLQWRVKASGGLSNENTYTFTFGYTPTPDAISVNNVYIRREGDYPNETITCKEWQINTSTGRYTKECTFTPGYNYSSSDYLFIRIIFNESYVTSIQSYISGFNERESTNAVITDQTNNIINNNNQNTQDIINNQNANTQAQIDSQMTCIDIDKNNIELDNKYINNGNELSNDNAFGVTSYIKLDNKSKLKVTSLYNSAVRYCFYDTNKTIISCSPLNTLTLNSYITIPNNTQYFRTTIRKDANKPTFNLCKNGNQALQDSIDDDNVSGANDKALDFFNNFNDNSHGLSSIITTPLNTIRLMLSDTCVAPHTIYKGKTISLPCGSILWSRPGANSLKDFLNLVYGGLISYYLIANLLSLVNDFKNPDNDKIEVTDL